MTNWLRYFKSYKTTAKSLAVVCVIIILGIFYIPVNVRVDRELIVSKGEGLSEIADGLSYLGLIRNRYLFIVYTRMMGQEKDLKAGRYIFSGFVNYPDILSKLSEGLSESDDTEVLIPEGSNIWEIDEKLFNSGLVKEAEFARKFYVNEGYLFPDKYRFPNPLKEKLTPDEYARRLIDNFNMKTNDILSRLNEKKLGDTIIVASILEKEARTEEDMKIISGIIRKRMDLGMALQIDATVTYGACLRKAMATNFARNCDVTLIGVAAELKIDSAYNTYSRKGLPAGPISNPGLVAINAALKPTKTDYLYYLSTRDGSQIIYAKTPAEHLANRKKYLGF